MQRTYRIISDNLREGYRQYRGIDWVACVITLISVWLTGNASEYKDALIYAFILSIFSSVLWGIVCVRSNVWSGLLFNVINVGLCVRNIYLWI